MIIYKQDFYGITTINHKKGVDRMRGTNPGPGGPGGPGRRSPGGAGHKGHGHGRGGHGFGGPRGFRPPPPPPRHMGFGRGPYHRGGCMMPILLALTFAIGAIVFLL